MSIYSDSTGSFNEFILDVINKKVRFRTPSEFFFTLIFVTLGILGAWVVGCMGTVVALGFGMGLLGLI